MKKTNKIEKSVLNKTSRKKINKGGRPTLLSNDSIKKLEYAFALDCTIGEACLYANISTQTYYNWIENDKELFDRFEVLRNTPVLSARTTVVENIKKDPYLALKYLERKKRSEFSTRVETTGADGGPVQTENVTDPKVLELLKRNGIIGVG